MGIKYFILILLLAGCESSICKKYNFNSELNQNTLSVNICDTSNIESYLYYPDNIGCNEFEIILKNPRRVHRVYYGSKYSCKTFEDFPFTTIGKPDTIDHIKAEDWIKKYSKEFVFEKIELQEINNKTYITILYPFNGLGIKYESNYNSDSLKIAITTFIFDEKKLFSIEAEQIHKDFISCLDFKN